MSLILNKYVVIVFKIWEEIMNVIAAYVVAKENLDRKIADKTAELYLTGMSYKDALKEAKKIYGYYDEKDA